MFSVDSILPAAAALFCVALAAPVLFRRQRTSAGWLFFFGMLGIAGETWLSMTITESDADPGRLLPWHGYLLQLKVLVSAIWLAFAITYSRGDAAKSLRRWLPLIATLLLLPFLTLANSLRPTFEIIEPAIQPDLFFRFGLTARILNGAALFATVLILMNLERTFRGAVGTTQWRVKYVVLGLAVIFGARFYTRSQGLVFSGINNSLSQIEAIGLLVGCVLLVIGYLRSGFGQIDVYPSRTILHTSLTILLVGGYLFFVGVLAQIVAQYGGSTRFQFEAFLILLGIAILAILLLSERIRQRVKRFVSHHFKRPQYDFRDVWTKFTHATSTARDEPSLCEAAAGLLSDTFNALSVSVWLFDEQKEKLILAASTSGKRAACDEITFNAGETNNVRMVFDLEKAREPWANALRDASAAQFSTGGNRLGVPLCASDRSFGLIVLADRVNAEPYTIEEHELLSCIGDQLASSLLNLRLAREIVLAKELEAFQTISAFFVHDLKNAASTLNLMLQNLPVHFDDPEFRADALRGIGETTARINQIIEGLAAVRGKLELRCSEVDLNALVNEALESVNGASGLKLVKDLHDVPKLSADREQLRSVVTNLLLNARDAVGQTGQIEVKTNAREGYAALVVSDDGCGMSPDFLRDSLFRPFKSTKKKGLGIGMFQTKMIVEAHRGQIRVTSDVGRGTTFQVLLPLNAP